MKVGNESGFAPAVSAIILYLSYAYAGEAKVRVRVVRFRESGNALNDRKVIIENIPAAQFHAGCRLRFGPDGKLYITTGDGTDRQLAKRLDSLAGKTLRLNDDGTIPTDNPFVGQQKVRPEIWSYGHRNAQGIDFQPDTGFMFQTEHGPGFDYRGGDEFNFVEKGKNYGCHTSHTNPGRDGGAFARIHSGVRSSKWCVLSRFGVPAV